MKQATWSFLILSLLAGCEEPYDKKIIHEEPKLVVECVLTNERKNQMVKLSLTAAEQNETPTPVSGAVLRISDGVETYGTLEVPAGSGNYFTREFRAVSGRTYSLQIQFADKEYTAEAQSVPAEPLRPLQYTRAGDKYKLVLSNSGQDPNYVDHLLTWRHTDDCVPAQGCEGRLVYYDLKTIDVNEIFKPEQQEFSFPANTIIVRRKYSLSPAYRDFLRSMLSETSWRGGVFDVQRANLPTNITGGAVGFFAVSTVLSDTTLITP